jgi:hypothetical protein
MRYQQRVSSAPCRTKEAALRNLVLKLVRRLSDLEGATYDPETGEAFFSPPDELRLVLADMLEAMGGAAFEESGSTAELFHVNGERHIVNKIDRYFRGAHTLRWVHRREAS